MPLNIVAALAWLMDGPLKEVPQEPRTVSRSIGVHSAAIFGDSSVNPPW